MSMRPVERQSFRDAVRLVEATMHDPSAAARAMPRVRELLAHAQRGIERRKSWQRLITVSLPVATVSNVAPIALTPFQWPASVHIVGVRCLIGEGTTAGLCATQIQIQKQNSENLFVGSQGSGAYVSFAQLLAGTMNSPSDILPGFYDVDEYAKPNEQWNYAIRVTTANTYTPEIVFAVEAWDPALDAVQTDPGR